MWVQIDASADGRPRHCGPVGSGHFVKMVHNGIEYGVKPATPGQATPIRATRSLGWRGRPRRHQRPRSYQGVGRQSLTRLALRRVLEPSEEGLRTASDESRR